METNLPCSTESSGNPPLDNQSYEMIGFSLHGVLKSCYCDLIKLRTDSHLGNSLDVKHIFRMQKNVNSKNDNSNAKPMLVLKFKENFIEIRWRPLVNESLVDTTSIFSCER